ncbi:MAG: MG2 domain-containing protein [Burkholderiales bacterium]
MTRARTVSALVLLAAGAGAAAAILPQLAPSRPGVAPRPAARTAAAAPDQVAAEPPGFRLSEGEAPADRPALVARPPATRLSAAETARVIARLPPLVSEPRVLPFALREASLPPPRAGRTVRTPFPPSTSDAPRPAAEAQGPLRVLRRAPEGDVPLAALVSVTFSQPMVALEAQRRLAPAELPVRLEPQPEGEWRWVGTRTLVFEPTGRFPMATSFRAQVAAGAKSALGATLASAESWSFATPAPRLVARHPEGGPVRRDALAFASFDQRIDKAKVLAKLRLSAAGAERPLRLATDEEVRQDVAVSRLARAAEPGRWLAFRADDALPPDAQVVVSVGPGVPSAEGPRASAAAESWSFRSFGPFRVRRSECGWRGRCTPSDPWRIELTNPIDAKSLRKDLVRIEPELSGLKLESWGETLAIRGLPRGRARYRVALGTTLRDVFGQELEPGPELGFDVGPALPLLYAAGGDFVVLDPTSAPSFPVYSIGHAALRVEAYAVTPADWAAWHAYRQQAWREEGAVPPGRRVVRRELPVAGDDSSLVETRVDLGPGLSGGLGQLVVVVRPATASRETRSQRVSAWVQATRIGLDAFADGETLLAWTNDLSDGRPLADVELALGGARARSQTNGLARLALEPAAAPLLLARRGADLAILPQNVAWWSEGAGYRRGPHAESVRFFVFDDRRLYKPGEEVRIKGWLRKVGAGPRGDVEPLPGGAFELRLTLRDSQGNEQGTGRAAVGRSGGFDAAMKLPSTFNLGPASLQLELAGPAFAGTGHVHGFDVQEFRRPEFEVKAAASEGPYVSGGAATVSVSAAYYAGGALPGAEVSWRVEEKPGSYRPPNREDFVFGVFVPWWLPLPEWHGAPRSATFAARTDASGVHRLRVDFDPQEPPRP